MFGLSVKFRLFCRFDQIGQSCARRNLVYNAPSPEYMTYGDYRSSGPGGSPKGRPDRLIVAFHLTLYSASSPVANELEVSLATGP